MGGSVDDGNADRGIRGAGQRVRRLGKGRFIAALCLSYGLRRGRDAARRAHGIRYGRGPVRAPGKYDRGYVPPLRGRLRAGGDRLRGRRAGARARIGGNGPSARGVRAGRSVSLSAVRLQRQDVPVRLGFERDGRLLRRRRILLCRSERQNAHGAAHVHLPRRFGNSGLVGFFRPLAGSRLRGNAAFYRKRLCPSRGFFSSLKRFLSAHEIEPPQTAAFCAGARQPFAAVLSNPQFPSALAKTLRAPAA